MTRILTTAAAALSVLALAACGDGGGSTPVEGQTTPSGTTTAASTTATTTTTPPTKLDAISQVAMLKGCVGGTPTDTYKWFQPTVDYAKGMGGDGFTVILEGKPVTLIAFPYAQAAQYALQDVTDRLIMLQQRRPTDYASVAATASQILGGNVVEIATGGAPSAAVNTALTDCVTKSRL